MISSTRIEALHEMFSNVTSGEWAFFISGAVAGTLVWVFLYRAFIKRFIRSACLMLEHEVWGILVQAVLGAAIATPNVLLFNLGEVHRNFLLAAFALTGMLFGLWVIIPEEPK